MRINRYCLTIVQNSCIIQDFGIPEYDLEFEPFDKSIYTSRSFQNIKPNSLTYAEVFLLNQVLKGKTILWSSI